MLTDRGRSRHLGGGGVSRESDLEEGKVNVDLQSDAPMLS